MRPLRMTLPLIFIIASMFYFVSCSSSKTDSDGLGEVTDYRFNTGQQIIENGPAPDFQMQMPDGSKQFLSDLEGKVVLLNFWAVNCPYCVLEMPYLQTTYDGFSEKDVVILGINVGENKKTVMNFLNGRNLSFPIILDPDIYASELYKILYLPTTYIIDKTGNIQIVKIGAYRNADEIITAVNSVLQ